MIKRSHLEQLMIQDRANVRTKGPEEQAELSFSATVGILTQRD